MQRFCVKRLCFIEGKSLLLLMN